MHIWGIFAQDELLERSSKAHLARNMKYLASMKSRWGMFHFLGQNIREVYSRHLEHLRDGAVSADVASHFSSILHYGDCFDGKPHGDTRTDSSTGARHPSSKDSTRPQDSRTRRGPASDHPRQEAKKLADAPTSTSRGQAEPKVARRPSGRRATGASAASGPATVHQEETPWRPGLAGTLGDTAPSTVIPEAPLVPDYPVALQLPSQDTSSIYPAPAVADPSQATFPYAPDYQMLPGAVAQLDPQVGYHAAMPPSSASMALGGTVWDYGGPALEPGMNPSTSHAFFMPFNMPLPPPFPEGDMNMMMFPLVESSLQGGYADMMGGQVG